MNKSKLLVIGQFVLGVSFGATIACSPTKFDTVLTEFCNSPDETCVTDNGTTTIDHKFKIGSGKVDILFVNDNSASMSVIQNKLAQRFAGFVERLDLRGIDYRIGVTTTDLSILQAGSLVEFANGSRILTKSDSNRVGLFNSAIVRSETKKCEDYIKSAFYTYGPGFQYNPNYSASYYENCPSNDERGIYTAYEVISNNASNLIRRDAHLNVIVLSNEDVRSGVYSSNTDYALEDKDKSSQFIQMVNTKYPDKYWEFNSIITKTSSCALQQQQDFKDKNGNTIKDSSGKSVIGANVGIQYAQISSSASRSVDGNTAPRGQVLDICSQDYSTHFNNIAAKIEDSARKLTLKCKPLEAPVVTNSNGMSTSVPYTWDGNTGITFNKGSEGILINVHYKCYNGVQ